MSGKKIGGGEYFPLQPGQSVGAGPDTPATVHDAGHHFKGVLFRHGHGLGQMRRGPITRMPLRGVGANRKRSGHTKVGGATGTDELDAELSFDVHDPDLERALRLQVGFEPQEHGSSEQSGDGERDKRRFAQIFQFAPIKDQTSGAGPSLWVASDLRARGQPGLPALRSMRDVVQFVHASTRSELSGKSVAATLRSINAV